MTLKYIIFNHQGHETPVIFPHDIMHKHMIVHSHLDGRSWPVSAGFCYIEKSNDGIKWVCQGESTSLKLKSRGGIDSAILNQELLGEES